MFHIYLTFPFQTKKKGQGAPPTIHTNVSESWWSDVLIRCHRSPPGHLWLHMELTTTGKCFQSLQCASVNLNILQKSAILELECHSTPVQ